MSSNSANGGSLPHNFFLTPHQQSLLFAALNTNNQQNLGAITSTNGLSASPNSFKNTSEQTNGDGAVQHSPLVDNFDYEFGDSSFDFSFASNADQDNMIGDHGDNSSSESPEAESSEKRLHPDDEDSSPGNDAKRHENGDRIPKKPGRKPLTSEPTTKRKAQNRAAQRAFRERKEKHLKDLETKVEELEKASEAANHENGVLRAQMQRMTAELGQYKNRMAMAIQNKAIPREKVPFGSAAVNNLSDVNFQFEFPKFGTLPGPQTKRSPSQPISPGQSTQSASPSLSNGMESKPSPNQASARAAQFKENLAQFSNIFTPSMNSSITNGSRNSLDSGNFSVSGATTSSPSASSNSNAGPSSSCGTSPEPFTQSPLGFKPVDTMSTIGEEQPSMVGNQQPFTQFANFDVGGNSLDWLASQNGGQFDPQLFGDYREPQDNILSNPSFDEFFNDALESDFFTPYNVAPSPATNNLNATSAPGNAAKKTLIDEIDAKQNADEDSSKTNVRSCTDLWDKLQDCPSARNGDFDLDGLCSELTKKAKCSGVGPVVKEQDFDTLLKKYMGKDVSADCVADKLGITVKPEGAA